MKEGKGCETYFPSLVSLLTLSPSPSRADALDLSICNFPIRLQMKSTWVTWRRDWVTEERHPVTVRNMRKGKALRFISLHLHHCSPSPVRMHFISPTIICAFLSTRNTVIWREKSNFQDGQELLRQIALYYQL